MISRATLTAAMVLPTFAAASVHAEQVLWDNYPSDMLQGATYNMGSEGNTQVVEST